MRAGDPVALALFNRFRQFPMPGQSFATGELDSLLDYFAAGGPIADGDGFILRRITPMKVFSFVCLLAAVAAWRPRR